jgi:hypothetical protein
LVPFDGMGTQARAVQVPEQQSPSTRQAWVSLVQAVPPQVPPVQASEQHSPSAAQASPLALQKASVVHSPPAQAREQHSPRVAQEAPVPLQVGGGTAAQAPAALQ